MNLKAHALRGAESSVLYVVSLLEIYFGITTRRLFPFSGSSFTALEGAVPDQSSAL